MNPIFRHRVYLTGYVALYAMFAAVYAAVFGLVARIPAEYAVWDGLVTGIVSGFCGLLLWNALKYGTEGILTPPLKAAYYLVAGLLFTGISVGMESAVMYGMMKTVFGAFAQTIPARSLCLALVYVLFALCYAYAGRSDKSENIPDAVLPPVSAVHAEDMERITVRNGNRIKVIGVGDIAWLQAEGDYVAIVTDEGRWVKEQTMKYFEENLPRGGFVRVHRSYMVSVSHISRIEQSGRRHSVILRDGTRIHISDAGYQQLRAALGL